MHFRYFADLSEQLGRFSHVCCPLFQVSDLSEQRQNVADWVDGEEMDLDDVGGYLADSGRSLAATTLIKLVHKVVANVFDHVVSTVSLL